MFPVRAGGHFSPHIDGPWVPREDESSVFTVVIYLNCDFQGGATKFLSEENQGECFKGMTENWWLSNKLH